MEAAAKGAVEMGVESSGTGDGASINDLGDSAPQGEKEGGRGKVAGEEEMAGGKEKRGRVKETLRERLN